MNSMKSEGRGEEEEEEGELNNDKKTVSRFQYCVIAQQCHGEILFLSSGQRMALPCLLFSILCETPPPPSCRNGRKSSSRAEMEQVNERSLKGVPCMLKSLLRNEYCARFN